MPANTTRPLFNQIESWLQEIDTTKAASATPAKPVQKKTAGQKKAAPAGMGETSHPSENVENNTQEPETGSRYDENASDVKKDVPGVSVDETSEGGGGSQDDKQFNIGTNQSATGEDPSVEDDYKGDKDDGTTSHPADAESTGEKYSSMSLKSLLKMAEDKGNKLLAEIAATPVTTKAATQAPKGNAPAPAAKSAAAAPTTQVVDPNDVGYKLAQDIQAAALQAEKVAADVVAQAISDAEVDADLVGSFLYTLQRQRTKRAGEGEEESEGGESAGEVVGGEGGVPPEMAGGEGGEGGGDALAALGGLPPGDPMGGGGGGGDPLAGGPPPGALDGGAGGPPGGDPAGGGMNQEQALQELVMALQELGISPEELAQMAQGQGADAGAEGQKLASAAKRFMRSGQFRFSEAKTAKQKQARDQIRGYILELTGSN